ncbi:unnamed protein product [Effrenium voratum]|nr:unnamed protein product [Effrenium voratum]
MSATVGKLASSQRNGGIFYGWVIVAVCILCKMFKIQGQNNVMSYTVPHLLEDFNLSHSELGGLFSVATMSAGLVQPSLGRAMDRFGARVCIPALQLGIAFTLLGFGAWRRPSDKLVLYLQIICIFFFLRMLSIGAGETFPNAAVQQWFRRKRGRAVGVVFTFQWLGNGLIGLAVSAVVRRYSWHAAAFAGSGVNLMLAPLSALLLRRSPEVCGLLPDGVDDEEEVNLKAASPEETSKEDAARAPSFEVRKLWPHLLFSFFYAVMYGGSDFYMVEMVAEASGNAKEILVSWHIFWPFALTNALAVPSVGELMDKVQSKRLPMLLLAIAALLTAVATVGLTCVTSRSNAVLYGVVRGFSSGIFQSLLTAGLAFAAAGVPREEIGRVLGFNQLTTVVGTGVGPCFYGFCRDLFGAFRGALLLTALPPLALSLYFWSQARKAIPPDAAGEPAGLEPEVFGLESEA